MAINQEQWLSEDNHRIILIDMQYHDGIEYKLKNFSSYPYQMPVGDTYVNSLGNSVSNISYDDIISSVPNILSSITSDTTIGQILLKNTDGEYDSLLNLAFSGHPIEVSIGEPGWVREDFINILDGITDNIFAPSPDKISILLRDKKEILNVNIQTDLIDSLFFTSFIDNAINNGNFSSNIINGFSSTQAWNSALAVLPEVTENTVIPICLGKCFNISPVLIDSYNHIYFVHEGLIESIDEVRANGIVLNPPAHASPQYEVDLNIGALRLLVHDGGSQITCDVTGQDGRGTGFSGDPLTKHSAAYLIEWLLLEKTTLTSSDLCQDTFPVTGSKGFDNISILGFYSNTEETVLSVITKIINSVGGYTRFTKPPCVVQLIKFIDPEGETPDLYLIADDIIENGLSVVDIEQPKKSLTFGYKKNWSVQDEAGLADLLTSDDFDFLDELNSYTNEFSTLSKNTTIDILQYPLATEQDIIESYIFNEVDAQEEIDRRIIIRSTKRFVYKIKSVATPFINSIGDIVNITHFRYNFKASKNALIIAMEEDPTNKRVTLEVWL